MFYEENKATGIKEMTVNSVLLREYEVGQSVTKRLNVRIKAIKSKSKLYRNIYFLGEPPDVNAPSQPNQMCRK